jgi:hypothetical protein
MRRKANQIRSGKEKGKTRREEEEHKRESHLVVSM